MAEPEQVRVELPFGLTAIYVLRRRPEPRVPVEVTEKPTPQHPEFPPDAPPPWL